MKYIILGELNGHSGRHQAQVAETLEEAKGKYIDGYRKGKELKVFEVKELDIQFNLELK